jgi:uncharacterized protein YbaA (DUF1428 family)
MRRHAATRGNAQAGRVFSCRAFDGKRMIFGSFEPVVELGRA